MKKVVCQSSSNGVTKAFARNLVAALPTGGLLLLQGELGAGKTTFVQGLAEALAVQQTITSPTFTLLNVYETRHAIIQRLVHLDLYRLTDSSELAELDLPTWLADPATLVVIEWPERSDQLQTAPTLLGVIQFTLGSNINQRILTITGNLADYFSTT